MAAAPERRYAASASVTAALQIAAMAVGGVIAVVTLHLFGQGVRTDGLFAAYGVYGLLVSLAQTFRTTVVPRLTEAGGWPELDRQVGGAVVLAALLAIPLVVLGEPVARTLTGALGPAAVDAARSALALLWLAALGQLVAALATSALAVRGEFGLPGAAYVVGGVVSTVLLVALAGPLSTDAVAAGVAAGSAVTAAILVGRLLAVGYRPTPRAWLPAAPSARAAWTMALGAVSAMVGQLTYLVTLAYAARLGEGQVTLYSYAFFASVLLMGTTSMPAAYVLAAPLTQDWDGRAASLRADVLAVCRMGFMIVVPALGVALTIGPEVVRALLGDAIGQAEAQRIIAAFVVLGVPVAASIATAVPLLAAFAGSRYGTVALVSLGIAVVHLAATAVAARVTDSLEGLAVGAAVSSLVWVGLIHWVVLRGQAPGMLLAVAREALVVTGAGAVAFAPALALGGAIGGALGGVAATLVGLAAFGVLLRLLPAHWDLVARVLDPLLARSSASRPSRLAPS